MNSQSPKLAFVHPLIRRLGWVAIKCPECGRILCEAQPGSVVKIICRKCRTESTVNLIAA